MTDTSLDTSLDTSRDASLDELGPVDYAVVEFPAGHSNFTGEMTAELLKLVDCGTIRVIDAVILTKNDDGTVDASGALRRRRAGRPAGARGPAGGAIGRGRHRAPSRRHGARKHRRRADLGEPMGGAIRISSTALRWPTDRQRTDPHSGDHRLHRSRRSTHNPRRLTMPLRPARRGRVGVIRAPVAKTAVVAKAVTPGPAPVAKTAVVAAAVTPGRRRRI